MTLEWTKVCFNMALHKGSAGEVREPEWVGRHPCPGAVSKTVAILKHIKKLWKQSNALSDRQ